MPCYHPLEGWRSRERNPKTGKRGVVFSASGAYLDQPVVVPCGKCIGCRLERSRQWAMRCVHEASRFERNSFITLTYDNDHLPPNGTLVLDDFQRFMKRLRKRFGDGIRFFHCGEYGAKGGRPHYHACLFNFEFVDRVPWQEKGGITLYRSEALEELWPDGFSTVGDVTFESAAYVARYIMKKVTGDKAYLHYGKFDDRWGEILAERKPEYCTMSRRPGLGREWLEAFMGDVYPHDFVEMRGKKMKPPKYYDSIFEIDNPEEFRKIKASRSAAGLARADDSTPARLAVREEAKQLQINKLIRSYENAEDVHGV